jgi:hypothetical protein
MAYLSVLYCTDEAIAVRDAGDFRLLVPAHQVVASGLDGIILPTAPWTLSLPSVAPSNDFVAQGLRPGHVVQLRGPQNVYPPPGDLLAVDSVPGPTTAILRRIGQPATGLGRPPAAPPPGSGITFLVATLGPQIERVSYDLNRRFGIDDNLFMSSTSRLYDLRELESACVLDVMDDLYLQMTRMGDANRDAFLKKHELIASELNDQIDRIALLWGPTGSDEPSTVRFGRLSR